MATPKPEPERLIGNAFEKIHDQMSIVREHTRNLGDPKAWELFQELEFKTLAHMRQLRLHLGIPYDWHEKKGQ